jgi:hypothetical protein
MPSAVIGFGVGIIIVSGRKKKDKKTIIPMRA